MASNSTGKWVERAATTGGGKSYRGKTPVNWYASLAVICIIGIALIVYSRYELTHQSASSSGPPIIGQQWNAAFAVDICGQLEPNLASNAGVTAGGFTTDGTGVISILPTNSSESGANATLGRFVTGYKGLELTNTELKYPGKPAYTNGENCPKGTPDAGKPGVVIVNYWPTYVSTTAQQPEGDPQNLRFSQGQLITAAFVPAGSSIPKPSSAVQSALLTAVSKGASQAPGATTTTAPSTTATTSATSVTTTTVAGGATTTTSASSTTTEAQSTTTTTSGTSK